MVSIYTLTLSPSLDSATQTPQIYPEGKLRCSSPVFEPGGGGINVARAITHLGGKATAIFLPVAPRVSIWSPCSRMRRSRSPPLTRRTGPARTCTFTSAQAASSTAL